MRPITLTQGSPEWLAWRNRGLGASDLTILSGVDVPWDDPLSPYDLWRLKTGRTQSQESTFAMRRGNRLEPLARSLYTRQTGIPVAPVCVEHDVHGWQRASLDGLDDWDEVVVEIKAPRKESHEDALDDRVPAYYVPQCQWQLLVTGCPLLHYWSYSENRAFSSAQQTALVEVRPDPEWRRKLLLVSFGFWGRVLADCWPDPVTTDPAPAVAAVAS